MPERPAAQPAFTREDYDYCDRVVKDIEHVRDTWVFGMDEDALRRESVVLRRLLTDNELRRAWGLLSLAHQPLIRATSLDAYLGQLNRDWVLTAFAPPQSPTNFPGDATELKLKVTRPIPVGSLAVAVPGYTDGAGPVLLAVPPSEADPSNPPAPNLAGLMGIGRNSVWETFTLSTFVASPAALLTGRVVKRSEIVTYTTNRLGSAHSGRAGSPQKKELWDLLDRLHGRFNHLHAIYMELVSIGRFLAQSTILDVMRARLERMPEPPGAFDAP